jgi:membrane protein DedA with SNARE-associated domain
MRRGGQAVMRRRFSPESIARVEKAYARFGFLALAVPALLPPPMPFKIFVATAGALEYPRWRFVLTIMLARSVRYYVEGTLAVFYGEQVVDFLRHNGMVILSVAAAVVITGIAVYVVGKRIRTPRRSMAEQVPLPEEEGSAEADEGTEPATDTRS